MTASPINRMLPGSLAERRSVKLAVFARLPALWQTLGRALRPALLYSKRALVDLEIDDLLRSNPAQLCEALERALHDPGAPSDRSLLAVHLACGKRARRPAAGEPGRQQGGRHPRRVGDGRVEPAGVGGQVLAPGGPPAPPRRATPARPCPRPRRRSDARSTRVRP